MKNLLVINGEKWRELAECITKSSLFDKRIDTSKVDYIQDIQEAMDISYHRIIVVLPKGVDVDPLENLAKVNGYKTIIIETK